MSAAELRRRLLELPSDPDPDSQLRPLARELASLAAGARYPAKSVAALRRHLLSAGVATTLLDSLLWMAGEILRQQDVAPRPESELPTTHWLSVERAAHALQKSPQTLREEWLRTVEGRRRLGWAWWDGQRWMIPEPAINPATRASYMASLPAEEPAAHTAALPCWCERSASV